jgi:hypothetical protein
VIYQVSIKLIIAESAKQFFEVENPVESFAVECWRIFNLKLLLVRSEVVSQPLKKPLPVI